MVSNDFDTGSQPDVDAEQALVSSSSTPGPRWNMTFGSSRKPDVSRSQSEVDETDGLGSADEKNATAVDGSQDVDATLPTKKDEQPTIFQQHIPREVIVRAYDLGLERKLRAWRGSAAELCIGCKTVKDWQKGNKCQHTRYISTNGKQSVPVLQDAKGQTWCPPYYDYWQKGKFCQKDAYTYYKGYLSMADILKLPSVKEKLKRVAADGFERPDYYNDHMNMFRRDDLEKAALNKKAATGKKEEEKIAKAEKARLEKEEKNKKKETDKIKKIQEREEMVRKSKEEKEAKKKEAAEAREAKKLQTQQSKKRKREEAAAEKEEAKKKPRLEKAQKTLSDLWSPDALATQKGKGKQVFPETLPKRKKKGQQTLDE